MTSLESSVSKEKYISDRCGIKEVSTWNGLRWKKMISAQFGLAAASQQTHGPNESIRPSPEDHPSHLTLVDVHSLQRNLHHEKLRGYIA